ncbi:antibiotic biosynthesis monooxygenase family protein [Pseudomonas fluorescens]|uniref:antibiotic biosynthesis monooxygenase family protein n=1 Tax=Pseudomonas fluorescens TaxID=294 RepID=UPI003747851A
MTINAANTLEIRLPYDPGGSFGRVLEEGVATCQSSKGCLGYSLSRSDAEPRLWIVSGYWHSEAHMKEHFSSAPMTTFVSRLIHARAHLTFSSLVPLIEVAASNGH